MAQAQSSEATSTPAKRARTKSAEPEHTFNGSSDFWFEDGNVILISAGEGPSKIGFKVHLGFLARHSEFFDDMFRLALPSASDRRACTNLPVTDSAEDLNYFLHAVYDIGYFVPERDRTPFAQLAGMLRVATKYICPKLRADVIAHLEEIYPTSRYQLDLGHVLLPKECLPNRVHAIHAIQMARENDVPTIMPAAFYLATTIHPMEYVLYNHLLTPDDDRRVIAGRARITEKVLEGVWSWLLDQPLENCGFYECRRTRWTATQDLARNASCAVNLFLEPMLYESVGNVALTNSPVVEEGQICCNCFNEWGPHDEHQYDNLWEELPHYFGLQGWKR
ncbi:hypothetical protein CPB85DRAFT_1258630 [Mucidula mucida]|nr:hypothetical protein CPB85DRAFT_1258630 [Mucidula mucida]